MKVSEGTGVIFKQIEISPRAAEELLKENTKRIHTGKVKWLIQLIRGKRRGIRRGIIVFDKEGSLQDGQHLLTAIHDCGFTVKQKVEFGSIEAKNRILTLIKKAR
jgi:hypothetical protein